jgi:mRNA interferase RelE/StbE
MRWTLNVARRAQKELARSPVKSQRLLLAALEEMQANPFGGDLVRLKGERSLWRRRVGAYRIFFDVRIEQRVVEVVDIARRTSTTY